MNLIQSKISSCTFASSYRSQALFGTKTGEIFLVDLGMLLFICYVFNGLKILAYIELMERICS